MKNNQLHIVLGGSGAIGNAVLNELKIQGLETKTIERSKNVEGFTTLQADLLNIEEITEATKGATHIYLCIGLPYMSKVWSKDWPVVMSNVISACEKNNSRLVFFDNVYMYGPAPLSIPFDENHTQNPQTKKGKARKVTTDLMLKAIRDGKINGVIGRSADFYGPNAVNSPFYISFLERMLQGKNPQLLSRIDVEHTYAYTLDNARALVALSLNEDTYGEVWHLPVEKAVTMSTVLSIFNGEMVTAYTANVAPKFIQKILGIFITPIREVQEMLYQFKSPYLMSSQKFMNKFPDFKVTNYETGIKEMIRSFKK